MGNQFRTSPQQTETRCMSPAEAAALDLEEPNWRERFESHIRPWPNAPRGLAEEWAFELTLKDWRRFHGTPVWVDGQEKNQPASATDAMVALAKEQIFPPRRLLQETPRDGQTGYQHDDHMWLQIAGEPWRIVGIEDRTLMLRKAFETTERQIDLNKAKWGAYVEAAAGLLAAMSG